MEITMLSQNLRCADDEGGNSVAERAPRFVSLVNEFTPDVIGTQETTARWMGVLGGLSDYAAVGCSRNGEDAADGEWNTLLYKKEKFDLLASGTFWLTDTPEETSRVEGAKCLRICTWARLREKESGRFILAANTHLDHSTNEIRGVQAVHLLRELRKRQQAWEPLFLTGDFNGDVQEDFYAVLGERYADAELTAEKNLSAVDYTFHGYGLRTKTHIDYCFYTKDLAKAAEFCVIDKKYGGFVSDHYGLLVKYVLQ